MADKGIVKQWKVYFQDESRFRLMTVLRRAITLRGAKPIGPCQPRFLYRYCYSLVEPLAGDHFFVTAPQVSTLYFEYMLQEFSRHEPEVFKIVFLDKAGNHKAKELNVPQNIRLVYLPSSNPELNLVERLWGDMKSKVAFHNFQDEQELEKWMDTTCKTYQNQQIASLTGYPYILEAIRNVITTM